jgi:NADH:ubiquinone oxidoreductase subunit 3 (subunit A)
VGVVTALLAHTLEAVLALVGAVVVVFALGVRRPTGTGEEAKAAYDGGIQETTIQRHGTHPGIFD